MFDKIHFPDPTISPEDKSRQLVAPNQIQGTWVTAKCAEEGCEKLLGHWSKDGSWKYPGARCDKHAKGARK